MSWNYRVYRHKTETGEEFLAIHEAYYPEDDNENPNGYTKEEIAPRGEDIVGLRCVLMQMLGALSKPILEYEEED